MSRSPAELARENSRAGATLAMLLDKWSSEVPAEAHRFADMLATFTTARDAVVAVAGSGDWTAQGRRQEIEKHARVAKLALRTHEQHATNLAERLTERRAQALKPTSKQRGVEELLGEREVRDALRGVDPLKVAATYLEACAAGEVGESTWRAIENAPGVSPLISAEVRRRGEELRLANSPQAAELDELEGEAVRAKLALEATRSELASLVAKFGVSLSQVG